MNFPIIVIIFLSKYKLQGLGQTLDHNTDEDIGGALIGITRKTPRDCPNVLIFDEGMPTSSLFIARMQHYGRQFIMLDLSEGKLVDLEQKYGSRNSSDIVMNFLHLLYRQRPCYTFQIWVKDPRILYPETESNRKYHPGWRWSDKIIIVAQHYTKRYKAFINLRFWSVIPNIVGLKRNNLDEKGIIKIFTVYPYFFNGKRKSQEIDIWNDTKREFVRNISNLFFDKFTNFHNTSIVLGVLWKEPFYIWGDQENPYLDGLDWRLFLLCHNLLKFSMRFKTSNVTGQKYNNNSWSGLMGDVADGSVHVGVGGISVTSERLKYFDFCRTYYTDSFTFISPHGGVSNSGFGTIFRPLSDEVWLATALAILVGIITMKLVAVITHRLDNYSRGRDKYFTSLWNICIFAVTVLCQKSHGRLPKTLAIQFVYYGLSLTMFCLGMVFSSCLISFILSSKPEAVADKLEDILKSGLPIAVKNYGGHLDDYMMHSGSEMLAQIYEKAELVDYNRSFDAIDDVVNRKKIFIDSKANIYFIGRYRYSGSRGLKFHVSSENVIEFANLGWPVQKNWPFTKKFDNVISRAVESGLVQHWIEYFMAGKFGRGPEAYKIPEHLLMARKIGAEEVDPSVDLKRSFAPLSISHLAGIIIIFLVGISLSILLFTCEFTIIALKSRCKNQKLLLTVTYDKMCKCRKSLECIKSERSQLNLISVSSQNVTSSTRTKESKDDIPTGNTFFSMLAGFKN